MAPDQDSASDDSASDDSASDPTSVLLDAVVAMSTDLDLRRVLGRIVASATKLTGARFGALGVIGRDKTLVEFITDGLTDAEREAIGEAPHGRGILGLLIKHPEPLRLADLRAHPESFGFPANHPPMVSFLGVPVRIRGASFGNLYLTEKIGLTDSDEPAQFTDDDLHLVESLATAAGFVIENARDYGLSERRRRWLEASARVSDALQPPIDRDRAFRQITAAARAVSGARAIAVVQPDALVPIGSIAVDPEAPAAVQEVLASLVGRCATLDEDVVELEAFGYLATLIPLRVQIAEHGVLVALFDPGYRPAESEERELLVSFADQAGLALDRVQGLADRAAMSLVSERERIARDLHDVVIQRLFATGLQLQGAAALTHEVEVQRRLDLAVDALDTTISEIRRSIFHLQIPSLNSLRAAVDGLVGEYADVLGWRPVLRVSGPVDTLVPAGVRDQVLAVLREALSNVAKHARAHSAVVELSATVDTVSLVVSDDGVGLGRFERESGLRNTRLRAEELGGALAVESVEPHGTRFAWSIPL